MNKNNNKKNNNSNVINYNIDITQHRSVTKPIMKIIEVKNKIIKMNNNKNKNNYNMNNNNNKNGNFDSVTEKNYLT